MSFEFPIAVSAIKLFAVIARIGAFVFALPSFSSNNIPAKYKVLFALVLSFALLPVLPGNWGDAEFARNLNIMKLVFILLSEVVLGLVIALFVLIILETFQFGGFVVDRSMGFIMATSVNPATETNASIFSGVFGQVFIIAFLATGGHHEVIRLAAASFRMVGPGEFMINPLMFDEVVVLTSKIFVIGLQMALPVFAVILFMNIGMGIIARIGQDFPVLMLSFPIRLGLGFIIMIAIFPMIIIISRFMSTQLIEWLAWLINIEL